MTMGLFSELFGNKGRAIANATPDQVMFTVRGKQSIALFLNTALLTPTVLAEVRINSQSLGDRSCVLQLTNLSKEEETTNYQLSLYGARPLLKRAAKGKWVIKPEGPCTDIKMAKAFLHLVRRVLITLDESSSENVCSLLWWRARIRAALDSESITAQVALLK